ncbi:MAG: glutamate--tRNA ligase family protein [Saprospiraceae bacterium]
MDSFAQLFFDFAKSVAPESRLRLAPTPSGFVHIGNALNFTLNWLAAKYSGGLAPSESPAKIYLRIDDLDADRRRPEYLDDIFDTLRWLNLDWDSQSGHRAIEQSDNLPRYFHVLERLRERGLLFACQKSRRELEPFGGAYPSEFREQNLGLDAPDVAWRIKTPPGFPLPDFVVRRRDGIPAYQVASLADDLHLGITHIVRGADLEDSTAAQRFLAAALSEENFLKIKFLHHPLVLGESGEKLSKSAGATSLKTLREAGIGPEKVFRTVGEWLGLEGDSAEKLLATLLVKNILE